jgi:flagellar basal-body rod modification protein FlgD
MNVPSVSGAQSTTDTTSTNPPSASVDYDAFLQLLIAQMKNQDPTNPMDSSQYMSQFAQFSSVEQSIQTNTKLDSLLSSFSLSQADGLIGHTAQFTSDDGQSTSAKITAVSIVQGGAVATLDDGTQVKLGPGITIT